jgi:hypothetical protein
VAHRSVSNQLTYAMVSNGEDLRSRNIAATRWLASPFTNDVRIQTRAKAKRPDATAILILISMDASACTFIDAGPLLPMLKIWHGRTVEPSAELRPVDNK